MSNDNKLDPIQSGQIIQLLAEHMQSRKDLAIFPSMLMAHLGDLLPESMLPIPKRIAIQACSEACSYYRGLGDQEKVSNIESIETIIELNYLPNKEFKNKLSSAIKDIEEILKNKNMNELHTEAKRSIDFANNILNDQSSLRMPDKLNTKTLNMYLHIYYKDAVRTALQEGFVSPALLQRKLQISYQLSSKIIQKMERDGIIGQADGAKPRRLL